MNSVLELDMEGDMKQLSGFVLMGVLAVASLLQSACATQTGSGAGDEAVAQRERVDEQMIKHIPPHELAARPARTRPSMRAELSSRNATGLPQGTLMDVLFDFDQATLRTDALPILEANAQRLKEKGATRLLLEGRGDEIGTAAYNLVLGHSRANHVKTYLEDLGLSVQLMTTSYGKDRPLCFQYSSDCMQKNRSVHFVIKE